MRLPIITSALCVALLCSCVSAISSSSISLKDPDAYAIFNETLKEQAERENALIVSIVRFTHLPDLLALAASVDRTLMANSQRIVPNKDILSATSLEDLVSGMSTRWAREWLRDGKPEGWISRLRNMGVEDYPDGLAPRLEQIWGIRNIIVDTAGIADADFIKQYPGIVAAAGDRVQVGTDDMVAFIVSVKGFLEPT